jgi:hypothetical protein
MAIRISAKTAMCRLEGEPASMPNGLPGNFLAADQKRFTRMFKKVTWHVEAMGLWKVKMLGIVFKNRRISRVIALKKAQNWPNSPVFAPFCAGF